ncbi:hypothetical protein ACO0LG_08615 [Undibacterium sp. Ji42W]|uniref:hypothetical protein n=1 Tax=Undibacterium sp. Ji42W TaxID=3413039 RepID=UPI003BF112BC
MSSRNQFPAHNPFPSLHTDGGTPVISAIQKSVTPTFREYVASILDAVAQGKPVEIRRMFTSNAWGPFDKNADRDIGFNFRHYEYRIKKETHTITFRLALLQLEEVVTPGAILPCNYQMIESSNTFIQWLGEEQHYAYEV